MGGLVHIWRAEIADGCDISYLLIWREITFISLHYRLFITDFHKNCCLLFPPKGDNNNNSFFLYQGANPEAGDTATSPGVNQMLAEGAARTSARSGPQGGLSHIPGGVQGTLAPWGSAGPASLAPREPPRRSPSPALNGTLGIPSSRSESRRKAAPISVRLLFANPALPGNWPFSLGLYRQRFLRGSQRARSRRLIPLGISRVRCSRWKLGGNESAWPDRCVRGGLLPQQPWPVSPGLQLGRVWSPVEPRHAKDANPSFFSKPFQIDRRDGVAAIAPFPSFVFFQFSCSVGSVSLQPRRLHHARLPCPSPTPGAWSNSGPSS